MTRKRLNVDQLSPKGLSLVSEFALVLYRLNGTIINVDSKDVLAQVIANARVSKDKGLLKIFSQLKREMQGHLMSSVSPQTASQLRKFASGELRPYR